MKKVDCKEECTMNLYPYCNCVTCKYVLNKDNNCICYLILKGSKDFVGFMDKDVDVCYSYRMEARFHDPGWQVDEYYRCPAYIQDWIKVITKGDSI